MRDAPLLELMKDKSGHDRTFKRHRVNFRLHVQAVAGQTDDLAHTQERQERSLLGFAHNLSLSGIGFVCSELFALEDMIEIEIVLEERTYLLLARVRWRRQMNPPSGMMHHYGAQFMRTEAILQFIPDVAEFLLAHGHLARRVGAAPVVRT